MGNDFLSPRSDVVFKLLFGDERHIELLTDFLKSVLRLPAEDYEEVTIVDPHLLREYDSDKMSVLDVKVRTRSKKVIDVDIQILSVQGLRERIVYYSAKMVTEQIGSGDDYRSIKRVVSIIITDFVFVPENDVYHNRYTLRDPETGSEFTDLLEVNTLELPKLPPTEDGTERWNWMKFLSARSKEELIMIAEKSPQVKKAVGRLMELSNDERARMLAESRQRMLWDIATRERAAREEGLHEGEQRGRQEGEQRGRQEIARSMLADGMAPDLISKFTGLSIEEIEALRR
jgi:predicted transposase/invertase (TIGR01784 family)